MISFALPFSTTVRVIHRIHGNSTHLRPPPAPAVLPGLSKLLGAMARVRDGSDGCAAPRIDELLVTGRKADQAAAGARDFEDLRVSAGGSNELGALAGADLEVVDDGSDSHEGERHTASDLRGNVVREEVVGH